MINFQEIFDLYNAIPRKERLTTVNQNSYRFLQNLFIQELKLAPVAVKTPNSLRPYKTYPVFATETKMPLYFVATLPYPNIITDLGASWAAFGIFTNKPFNNAVIRQHVVDCYRTDPQIDMVLKASKVTELAVINFDHIRKTEYAHQIILSK